MNGGSLDMKQNDDVYILNKYEWVKRIVKDGKKITTMNQNYDETGNILKEITIIKNYNGNIIDKFKYVYKYDENGRESCFIGYGITIESEYDEQGNEIRQINKNADGKIKDIYIREFDNKGNRIKSISKNSDGSILRISESIYDVFYNEVKIISSKEEGNIVSMSEYKYMRVGELDG